jgi:hypothetical protein
MGTNYYWEPINVPPPCPTCGHAPPHERLHVGKSSAGWTFTFQAYPARGVTSFLDWRDEFERPGWRIVDEYGVPVPLADFLALVREKVTAPFCQAKLHPPDRTSYLDAEGHAFTDGDFS